MSGPWSQPGASTFWTGAVDAPGCRPRDSTTSRDAGREASAASGEIGGPTALPEGWRPSPWRPRRMRDCGAMKYLVTGGAGFIGCNAVQRWLRSGHVVVVVDDLSRRGADANLAWLQQQGGQLLFEKVDIRDAAALDASVARHRDAAV